MKNEVWYDTSELWKTTYIYYPRKMTLGLNYWLGETISVGRNFIEVICLSVGLEPKLSEFTSAEKNNIISQM